MNWDEDIDFLAGRKVKDPKKPEFFQSQPKQGRRSNDATPEGKTSDFFADSNPFDTEESDVNKTLPKPRKTSVWGEEGNKSAKSSKSSSNIIEMERFQSSNQLTSPEDDIPVIPDIDDLQDDPLNLPDTKPVVIVDKSTYKELDTQLGSGQEGKINFGNLGNIDLSFLTNKLCGQRDVQLKPEIWTMESLFNDLSRSEM